MKDYFAPDVGRWPVYDVTELKFSPLPVFGKGIIPRIVPQERVRDWTENGV